jgi:hypothetical protein
MLIERGEARHTSLDQLISHMQEQQQAHPFLKEKLTSRKVKKVTRIVDGQPVEVELRALILVQDESIFRCVARKCAFAPQQQAENSI